MGLTGGGLLAPSSQSPDVVVIVDDRPRCTAPGYRGRPCNRLLAEYAGRPWSIRCGKCGALNERGIR